MAIFSVRSSFIQRSKGQSAVSSAAYQAGERICDERTGQVYNYSSRSDVAFTNILAPADAPDWVFDRAQLWNKVEQFEDELINHRYRGHHTSLEKIEKSEKAKAKALSTASTAWSQVIALPRELTEHQNKEWLEQFIKDRFIAKGLIVDYAIHNEKGNPHAHLKVTLRSLDGQTLSKIKEPSKRKPGNIFDKAGLKETRGLIAEAINGALERYGFEDRVSHLSLKDQGLSRLPTRHEGYHARHLEATHKPSVLIEENRRIRAFNLSQYLEHPHLLIKDMSLEKASFSDKDVRKTIYGLCDGDSKAYQALLSQVGRVQVAEGAITSSPSGLQFDSSLLRANPPSVSPLSSAPSLDSYPTSFFGQKVGFDGQELAQMIEALKAKARVAPLDQSLLPISHTLSGSLLKESGESEVQALVRYLNTPDEFVKDLAKQKVVFKAADIEKALRGLVGEHDSRFQMLRDALKGETLTLTPQASNQNLPFTAQEKEITLKEMVVHVLDCSPLLIRLNKDFLGDEVYTSSEQVLYEKKIIESVETLKNSKITAIEQSKVFHEIQLHESKQQVKNPHFSYSLEQRAAIEHLTSEAQLKVLTGRAGTGKTTVLKPVAAAYRRAGLRVKGIAFQGKVSDALARDVGIEASTIDSLLQQWKSYEKAKEAVESGKLWGKALAIQKKVLKNTFEYQWDNKTAVILDEGSMVSQGHYQQILEKAAKTGATLLIVQDGAQIKALFGADISRAIEEKVGSQSLTQVVRQQASWMREASALLNDHRVEEAVFKYEEGGCVHYRPDLKSAREELVESFLKSYQDHPSQSHAMLAFKNSDIAALNKRAFDELLKQGVLTQTFKLGAQTFAVGAEVVFTQNDAQGHYVKEPLGLAPKEGGTGVFNGTFGRIIGYNAQTKDILIQLKADGRKVVLNETVMAWGRNYTALELAYALTVNKAQGETFDHVGALFDPLVNANTLLVQLTRHREKLNLYVSSEQAANIREIAANVGSSDYKPLTSDYQFEPGEEGAFQLVEAYKRASMLLADTCQNLQRDEEAIKDGLSALIDPLKEKRDDLAREILHRWQETRRFAKQAHIREEVLETHAGLRSPLLNVHERELVGRIEEYYHVSLRTRECWEIIQRGSPGALSSEHPYYQDFLALRERRDLAALRIVAQAESAQRLFKVEYIKDMNGQISHYRSAGGGEFEKRPPTFKTALKQAEELKKRQQEKLLGEVVWGRRQALYDLVVLYKSALKQANYSYHDLAKNGTTTPDPISGQPQTHTLDPFVKLKLEELEDRSVVARDKAAIQVIDWLLKDKQSLSHERFLKKLGIETDKLLTHAVFGELRMKIEAWEKASSLEDRLSLAEELERAVFGEDGKSCQKPIYALVKRLGIDPTRLRYESAYSQHLQQGGEIRFQGVKELELGYSTLEDYRSVQHSLSSKWKLLKSGVDTHITGLQQQQIAELQKAGWTQGLNLSLLSPASHTLPSTAAANDSSELTPQQLASVNAELQGIVSINSGRVGPSILHRQASLNQYQQPLRKGMGGYLELADTILQTDEGWRGDHQRKLKHANQVIDLNGAFLERALGGEAYGRLLKESRGYQLESLIGKYEASKGATRAGVAQAILKLLNDSTDKSRSMLERSLKDRGIDALSLHLYGLLGSSPALSSKLASSETLRLIKDYSTHKAWSSDLHQKRCEMVEPQVQALRAERDGLEEEILRRLEANNPHGSYPTKVKGLFKKLQTLTASPPQEAGVSDIRKLKQASYKLVKDSLTTISHDLKFKFKGGEENEVIRLILKANSTSASLAYAQNLALKSHPFPESEKKDYWNSLRGRQVAAFDLMHSSIGADLRASSRLEFNTLKRDAANLGAKKRAILTQAQVLKDNTSLETRLEASLKLAQSVYGKDGKTCHKAHYAFLKGLEVDPLKVRYDARYAEYVKAGGLAFYTTAAELDQGFNQWEAYRAAHLEASLQWQSLRQKTLSHVTSQLEHQLRLLDAHGIEKPQKVVLLEEKLAQEGDKGVHPYQLAELNAAVRSMVQDQGVHSALPSPILDQQRILNSYQKSLRKGRSAIPELAHLISGDDGGWHESKTQKLPKAHKLLEAPHEFIQALAGDEVYQRLVKEQKEYQALHLVEQYAHLSSIEKAPHAVQMLQRLDEEAKENQNFLKAAIKEKNLSFESLHLYGLLGSHIEKNPSSLAIAEKASLIEGYISAKQVCASLWAARCQAVEGEIAGMRDESLNAREQLINRLEAISYHPSYGYRIDQMVDALHKIGDHSEESSQGAELQRPDVLYVSQSLNSLATERGFLVSEDDLSSIVGDVLELARQKSALFKAQTSAMKAHAFTEEETRSFYAAASARNQAANKLVQSGLLDSLKPDDSPHWSLTQIEDYASRINGKSRGLRAVSKTLEETTSQKSVVPFAQEGSQVLTPLALSSPPQSRSTGLEFNQFLNAVDTMLDHQSLAQHLLGGQGDLEFNNKLSRGKKLRFGKKGHFALDADSGLWKNFKTNEGGNSWTLIKHYEGGSFYQQLEALKPFCRDNGVLIGQYLEGKTISRHQTRDLEKVQLAREEERQREAKLEAEQKEFKKEDIRKLYDITQPLKDTQAEQYLANTRKIAHIESMEIPSLRFVAKGTRFSYGGKSQVTRHDAMAAFARDKGGQISAVQMTSLEGDQKADIAVAKRTYGVQAGSFVEIQQGEKTLWLAEGVETALSLRQAGFSGQIEAALGISNLKNREVSKFETVVICADNDEHKPHSTTYKTVAEAQEAYESLGKVVHVVKPHIPGQDFNDVLKLMGKEGVREHFDHLIELKELSPPTPPAYGHYLMGRKIASSHQDYYGFLLNHRHWLQVEGPESALSSLNKELSLTYQDYCALKLPFMAAAEERYFQRYNHPQKEVLETVFESRFRAYVMGVLFDESFYRGQILRVQDITPRHDYEGVTIEDLIDRTQTERIQGLVENGHEPMMAWVLTRNLMQAELFNPHTAKNIEELHQDTAYIYRGLCGSHVNRQLAYGAKSGYNLGDWFRNKIQMEAKYVAYCAFQTVLEKYNQGQEINWDLRDGAFKAAQEKARKETMSDNYKLAREGEVHTSYQAQYAQERTDYAKRYQAEKRTATPLSNAVEAQSRATTTATAPAKDAPTLASSPQHAEGKELAQDAYEWVLKGRDWMAVQGLKEPMVSTFKWIKFYTTDEWKTYKQAFMKKVEDSFLAHPDSNYRPGFKALELRRDAALHASVGGAIFDYAFREEGKILIELNEITPSMKRLAQDILNEIPAREVETREYFEGCGIEPRLVQTLARLQTHAELFNPHTSEAYREHLSKIGFMLYKTTGECHAQCLSQMPEKGLSREACQELAEKEASHLMTQTVIKALERHDPHSPVKCEVLDECYRDAKTSHLLNLRQEVHRQLKPPAQDRSAKQALELEF